MKNHQLNECKSFNKENVSQYDSDQLLCEATRTDCAQQYCTNEV
jgi:hypothetical protein